MSDKCHSCKNESNGKWYCVSCQLKQNEKNQKRRTERFNAGLCTNCGEEKDTNWRMCSKCQAQNSNGARRRNKEKLANGRCNIYNCDNKRMSDSRFCKLHRKEDSTRRKKRCLKLVENGLCTVCGKEPFLPSLKNKTTQNRLCLEHYLKLKAINRIGDSNLWINLLNKLEEQNYKCFYSGEKLILGENDSVDHSWPISHFPEKANDITNIQWVSRKVNDMKDDNTHEEFMKLITQIYKNRKKMERKEKVPPSSPN